VYDFAFKQLSILKCGQDEGFVQAPFKIIFQRNEPQIKPVQRRERGHSENSSLNVDLLDFSSRVGGEYCSIVSISIGILRWFFFQRGFPVSP
jgi:hypothetical protein